MIAGKAKTEKEYRAVQMDSSSSLKEFSTNRKAYHKKYILGEKAVSYHSKNGVKANREALRKFMDKRTKVNCICL